MLSGGFHKNNPVVPELRRLHSPALFGLEMEAPDDLEKSGPLIQAMIDPKGGTGRRVLRLRGLRTKMARGERINRQVPHKGPSLLSVPDEAGWVPFYPRRENPQGGW